MSVSLRNNLIDISIHVIIAIIGSMAIYDKTGNAAYVFIFVMGGIFIDLDHLIDYFLYFKNKFSLVKFFGSNYVESGRVYVVLHSWELILFLYLAGLAIKSAGLVMLTMGLAAHLATDCVVKRKFLAYILAYRIANKFDAKLFS